ncbi:MAG: flagellar export chaperone FliS [Gammaproteobacteria bacterium]|nr:flagellar export chaperone FliS [Gammaproteobacteria bacterium]
MNAQVTSALNEYQSTDNSSVAYADPHELIVRLMDGALDRIAQAKCAIEQHNIQQKGERLSKAIAIIGGLSSCLDHDKGGEISTNLNNLYEYMNLRLFEANIEEDTSKLDEVSGLLKDIRDAWVAINPELENVG